MTPAWLDDLSLFSLEEVVASQMENRAWRKRLRLHAADVVNQRLAHSISSDEYTALRVKANAQQAECIRRGEILAAEIEQRLASTVQRPGLMRLIR